MSPERPSGRADRLAVVLLFLLGLWIVIGLRPLGWGYIRDHDMVGDVHRVLIGFLFLFLAGSILERQRLRKRIGDIYEAMNMLLYGKNYKRDREAIRILLNALRSKDPEVREKAWKSLKELTGRDFALDAEVWESWWQANERRFAVKTKRPDEQ